MHLVFLIGVLEILLGMIKEEELKALISLNLLVLTAVIVGSGNLLVAEDC